MTTIEYAQKITDIIDARPRRMDLDELLYEINIHTKGVPTKRKVAKGGWETYGEVMKLMRKSFEAKSNGRNGLKKISKRSSTISSYAQKIIDFINARPRYINLDKLLYTIYVQASIAESRRDQREGRWSTHEQVMERMWKRIYSKFDGHNQRKKISIKSSTRSRR